VVDEEKTLTGVITRNQLQLIFRAGSPPARPLSEMANRNPEMAYADEPLRVVVNRMADTGFTRLPVVDRDSRKLVGMVSLNDLLRARTRSLEEERQRERVLRIHLPFRSRPLK
jgi:chloride channel protein, CIC family